MTLQSRNQQALIACMSLSLVWGSSGAAQTNHGESAPAEQAKREEPSSRKRPSNGVLRTFGGIVASHALPSEPSLWTEVGTIDVEGFSSFVLSVYGEMQGGVSNPGVISVVFVPETPQLSELLHHGEVHLAIEAQTRVIPGPNYYFSRSFSGFPIGFPRYRVFVYNTADRYAFVNIYAYLTR